MVVAIEFMGEQRTITNTPGIKMPISEKTRVADAIEYVKHHFPALHLDEAEVLIAVNQEMASPDRILKANDTLLFLPFIHGG